MAFLEKLKQLNEEISKKTSTKSAIPKSPNQALFKENHRENNQKRSTSNLSKFSRDYDFENHHNNILHLKENNKKFQAKTQEINQISYILEDKLRSQMDQNLRKISHLDYDENASKEPLHTSTDQTKINMSKDILKKINLKNSLCNNDLSINNLGNIKKKANTDNIEKFNEKQCNMSLEKKKAPSEKEKTKKKGFFSCLPCFSDK
jgi:hypothetical protein